MSKNVIVLGGGYAGILTAKNLAKLVKKNKMQDEVTIKLIDRNPYHTMLTELHEVAADRVEEDAIKMELSKIFAGRNVEVVLDNIKETDSVNKKLVGEHETYEYDYLVVATGSKQGFFGISGAEENAFSLWSFDDAVKIKRHVRDLFDKASFERDDKKRRELLNFNVVGGGFTGVEMAGELAEWVPYLCEEFHIKREDVAISLVEAAPNILNFLPEKGRNRSMKRFEKLGVKVLTNTLVTNVSKTSVTLKTDGKENPINTSTVIWAAGIEGSDFVQSSGMGAEATRKNRIETNDYLQFVDDEAIYVVGDNLHYKPKGHERPVPQMVENAEHSASTAANNLFVAMTGKGTKKEYQPAFHGAMVCIGGRYGQAYVGLPNKMFSLPSFFAMFSKHFINIVYFIQVLGWNKTWSYLKHEIFQARRNRSFVGGHLANYQPTFWSFPLRLFLGLMWFTEGIVKFEKMLVNPKNIFIFTIPETQLLDGITSSTPWGYTEHLPSIFYTIESFALSAEKALPIPGFIVPMVDWSMNTFIIPIAPLFQIFMICAEIVIGLCLLAGLFTSCISLFSVVICFMIYMSGAATKEILWYAFAALSLVSIGGTGHALSFDYYIMPWLKGKAKNIKFIKKWYLYND